MRKSLLCAAALFTLVGCESENEHFCAKYEYYHNELAAPDTMPLPMVKEQLNNDLRNPDKDMIKTRFALYVLDELVREVKPEKEEPIAFCMRTQRWRYFREM